MATPLEQVQLEVMGLRQQVQNLEVNSIPAVTQRITLAFDTIAQHQEALTAWQITQLDNVKTAVDGYANDQKKQWSEAVNELKVKFNEQDAKFMDAQAKFTIMEEMICTCAGGSFTDFTNKFSNMEQQLVQLNHNINMHAVDIVQIKDMLKQGMGLVNDRITTEVQLQNKFRQDLDFITKDTGGNLQAALAKITDFKHDKKGDKNIMEYKAISNMEKLTGDKRNYNLWLEKFKNAFVQVDGGRVRAVLTILENNMDMLKPKQEGSWNGEVAAKLADLNIGTEELDLIKEQLYTVLIDKVNGDMIIDIKNQPRDGLLSFLVMHRWFMETSGQGIAQKRTYVMHPPAAKSEAHIYEAVRQWEREIEDLMRLKGTTEPILDDSMKITALKAICCGKIKDVVDLREASTDDFNEIRNEVMTYAMKKKAEGQKTTTESGSSLSALLSLMQEKMKQTQSNYYPSWGNGQEGFALNLEAGINQAVPDTEPNSEDEMINQLFALMSKGKGKGKGGGGKGQFNGTCYNCGKYGHSAKNCRKGKGKGWEGDKGKGKGYEGKGKGKGGCFICGGPHYQRDCPKGGGKGKGKDLNWVNDANQAIAANGQGTTGRSINSGRRQGTTDTDLLAKRTIISAASLGNDP